jgi:hypothetical protein
VASLLPLLTLIDINRSAIIRIFAVIVAGKSTAATIRTILKTSMWMRKSEIFANLLCENMNEINNLDVQIENAVLTKLIILTAFLLRVILNFRADEESKYF